MSTQNQSVELSTNVVTPIFRASYPALFKARFNRLNNKNQFSVEAIFPPEKDMTEADKKALAMMRQAAQNALIKEFGPDKTKWPKNLKSPFRDQADKEKEGKLAEHYTRGALWCRFVSEQRPGVVGKDRQEILDESTLYAGCYLRAQVNAFAYSQAGNNGVSFGLNHIQFVKDGEPFSSRPSVEAAFEAIVTEEGTTAASGTSASDLW